jgi:hypothetical protein
MMALRKNGRRSRRREGVSRMRRVSNARIFKPVEWISMRYEADCWHAACAMAIGASYEEAEEYLGPGAEYSDDTLSVIDDPEKRFLANALRFLIRNNLFTSRRCYPLFIPEVNPALKVKRRYLLSSKSPGHDPQRPWMSHSIVLDESGKVFDLDPKYDPSNPKYSIQNYPDLIAWEIVQWEWE